MLNRESAKSTVLIQAGIHMGNIRSGAFQIGNKIKRRPQYQFHMLNLCDSVVSQEKP